MTATASPDKRPASSGAATSTPRYERGPKRRTGESSIRRKALALAAFLILAASALNALFGDRGFLSLGDRREEYRLLLDEIAELERGNIELAETIRAYRTDPLVIERRAREVLGMARQGEIAVSVRHSGPR